MDKQTRKVVEEGVRRELFKVAIDDYEAQRIREQKNARARRKTEIEKFKEEILHVFGFQLDESWTKSQLRLGDGCTLKIMCGLDPFLYVTKKCPDCKRELRSEKIYTARMLAEAVEGRCWKIHVCAARSEEKSTPERVCDLLRELMDLLSEGGY